MMTEVTPPRIAKENAAVCRQVLMAYQEEGYSHRSNMRQFNSSAHYCRNVGVCSVVDIERKLSRRMEMQQANVELGLKNAVANHPDTSKEESAREQATLEDLATEINSLPPASLPNYVEECLKSTETFFASLSTMGREVNKHHMMSGMVRSFCMDVVMCNIPNTTVTAVDAACTKASEVYLNVDPSIKMTESNQNKQKLFCSMAGSVDVGGPKEEEYMCPQNMLHQKMAEQLEMGLKLSSAGENPTGALRGKETADADWKLSMEKNGKVTREERKEWSEYVERRD